MNKKELRQLIREELQREGVASKLTKERLVKTDPDMAYTRKLILENQGLN